MGLAVCESYLTQFLDPLLEHGAWLCAPTKVGTAITAKKTRQKFKLSASPNDYGRCRLSTSVAFTISPGGKRLISASPVFGLSSLP